MNKSTLARIHLAGAAIGLGVGVALCASLGPSLGIPMGIGLAIVFGYSMPRKC